MEPWVPYLFVTLIGMGWGSFATMAIYRIPHGEPWIGRKPFCPGCNHDLTFWDYISIISWFTCKGKCRYCGAEYTHRLPYLITEITCTILFITGYWQFGLSEEFVLLTALGICATILAVIHIEHNKVPAQVLISCLLLAVAYRAYIDHSIYGILWGGGAATLMALIARHIAYLDQPDIASDYLQYKKEGRFSGPGFDCIKIMTLAGIWLSWAELLVFMLLVTPVALFHYLDEKKRIHLEAILIILVVIIKFSPQFTDVLMRLIRLAE